jgi:hypothetical protein
MYALSIGEIPADLIDVATFQRDTAHVVHQSSIKLVGGLLDKATQIAASQKSRGRIYRIDAALAYWHQEKQSVQRPTVEGALYGVIKECQHWLKAKAGSNGTSTAARRQHVQTVRDAAWANLVVLNKRLGTMEERKADPLRQVGALKTLSGSYAHERSFYLESGKTKTASGSLLHSTLNNDKKFETLSEKEYFKLAAKYGSKNNALDMMYLDKLKRSEYLLTIDNGLLYDAKGEKINSDYLEPYAIDQYGNVFTMRFHSKWQINHSSFLAGKEVICAGCLGIRQGKLISIDNNSGHYKPQLEHLLRAIHVIEMQGADMTATVAGLKRAGEGLKWYKVQDLKDNASTVVQGLMPHETEEPDFRG